MHRLLSIAAIAGALAIACGTPETALSSLLAESPDDDRAWSERLDHAAENNALEPLAAEAVAVADAHADAWAPPWIAGEAFVLLERGDDAQRELRRALRRARDSSVDVGIAQACNELGWMAYDAGELEAGAALYVEGIEAATRAGREDLQAFLRNNLAGLRVEQGRLADARDELETAAALLSRIGMEGPAAGLRYNRAALEWKLGNLRAASATLDRVETSATAAGDEWTLAAVSVVRGHIARARGDLDAAAGHYEGVSHSDADVGATAALGLGLVERSRGEFAAAGVAFAEAVEIAAEEEPLIAALAGALRADTRFDGGDPAAGAAELAAAIAGADAAGDGQTAWVARHLLARRLLADDPAGARELLDAAVELLEASGDALDPLGDGLYLLRGRAQVYVDAARSAVDDPARVWELAGLQTGRALRGVGRTEIGLTFDEARARLGDDEAVLVLLGSAGEGVSLLVTDDDAVAKPIRPPGPGAVAAFAESVRSGIGGGAELTRRLLTPHADGLRGVDRLWLVIDGALAALPFGALPWGEERFGTRFAYGVLPTAGVPGPAQARAGRGDVLLAGAPLFDESQAATWSPLPFAAREIARLQTLWQERATAITGDDLHRETLDGLDWRRFGLIHFATHAEASSVDPRANGLILSGGERFDLDRILGGSFPDATVVLSACSTAVGERVPGQGRLGLVWAFHVAGAEEVVASQWAVDDRGTAGTMALLHGELRGGADAAAAMRRVRRQALADGLPASVWAAFEVYRRP